MPTKTNISGFPEYLPAEQLAFNSIVAKVTQVYQSFGFVPLETAAVERIDTLTSKGIDSKEVYALRRLNAQGDEGDKDIALRFDLTVPLARYVAQNYADLTFPFRRYQVQPVWRGERAQKGRYRQFHQFDIDTIGDATLPIAADAEILAAANLALTAILPAGTQFTMRVNNRQYLQNLCQKWGYSAYEAIKIIDNLEKIPEAQAVQELATLNPAADGKKFITQLKANQIDTSIEGAEQLQIVLTLTQQMLGGKGEVVADLTIARGLDYYTGTVVETRLESAPELGSICSGGRYDNLTESLSDRKLPGVGISIGLSRLAVWLMDQEPYKSTPASTASAIVTGPEAATAAAALRAAGLNVELALGDKSAGQHFQNAAKRGLQYGIVAENGTLTLRPFATRQDEPDLTPAQIATKLKS
jgi:histidyl-tRNA synthetase